MHLICALVQSLTDGLCKEGWVLLWCGWGGVLMSHDPVAMWWLERHSNMHGGS